jgi:hypothetical protein
VSGSDPASVLYRPFREVAPNTTWATLVCAVCRYWPSSAGTPLPAYLNSRKPPISPGSSPAGSSSATSRADFADRESFNKPVTSAGWDRYNGVAMKPWDDAVISRVRFLATLIMLVFISFRAAMARIQTSDLSYSCRW